MKAKAISREAKKREIRAAKTGNARQAIGPIAPGMELYVLTYGQFSLIDTLITLVEQTGPADVTLSTWTAGSADLTTAARLMEHGAIRSLRFVVDRSFLTRQPDYCAQMRRLFGDNCIRTTRSHCKFITVRNDEWALAVRTSMNLNENPRLENLEVSDDPALCAFLEAVADELFEDQEDGLFNSELPRVSMATPLKTGVVSTGPRT